MTDKLTTLYADHMRTVRERWDRALAALTGNQRPLRPGGPSTKKTTLGGMSLGTNPVTLRTEDVMKKRVLRATAATAALVSAVHVLRIVMRPRKSDSKMAERILMRYRQTFEILART